MPEYKGNKKTYNFNRQSSIQPRGDWQGRTLERKSSGKKRVCYAWKTTGLCRHGSYCRYAHDEELAYTPPDYTHRRWSHSQATTRGASDQALSWSFSLMSYNTLADELAVSHAKELYKAVPELCLRWPSRIVKLLEEILYWKPDIVCLQEVDHPDDFTGPLQPTGYEWCYTARTGGRGDGCLTLWKGDKFDLLAYDHIKMQKYGLNDNVGLIAVLKPRTEAKATHRSGDTSFLEPSQGAAPCFAVANTHLLFNPKRGDVKLGQVGLILRRVAQILEEMGVEQLAVLTGDFNSTPHSGVYSFIREGELDCFMEDRRNLSGQLADNSTGWSTSFRTRLRASRRFDEKKRGASLDDPSRNYKTYVGLQKSGESQLPVAVKIPQPIQSLVKVGLVGDVMQNHIAHSSSFPMITEAVGGGLRGTRRSGPLMSGSQGPLYPYADQFGQVAWSHIPPSEGNFKRLPFFHEPMTVEEATPPPPSPLSTGICRTLSFAQRQENANTWTYEQLAIASGHSDEANLKLGVVNLPRLRSSDTWLIKHPLPLMSTYEAVLGTEPDYTSCHGKFIGTVDYIWFTPKSQTLTLKPERVLLPPPLESLHCGLPSPQWPSDHISLLATFTISSALPVPS